MKRKESIQNAIKNKTARTRFAKETADAEPTFQKEIKSLLTPLLWDRDTDEMYYLQLLKKDQHTPAEEKELQALFIKILNFNNWYTVVSYFGIKYAVEQMLTENVIKGLFPRPLRKKYEFVRNVLSEAV